MLREDQQTGEKIHDEHFLLNCLYLSTSNAVLNL